ncbi:MAG: hypothetical protein K1W16_14305 [Lachnospiraceae bacterium]
MKVKKITPKELPAGLTFILKNLYHADLSKFIAMVDVSKSTLFVNKKMPQKDIDGFLEVITFPDYWVADEESGKGQFLEHVYTKYGKHTYKALLDAHTWQMEQKEKWQAAETAKKIIPLIEKEINSENPAAEYNERLVHEIWSAGYRLNRRTSQNASNYGSMYEFYFGYLLGAGMLKGGI